VTGAHGARCHSRARSRGFRRIANFGQPFPPHSHNRSGAQGYSASTQRRSETRHFARNYRASRNDCGGIYEFPV